MTHNELPAQTKACTLVEVQLPWGLAAPIKGKLPGLRLSEAIIPVLSEMVGYAPPHAYEQAELVAYAAAMHIPVEKAEAVAALGKTTRTGMMSTEALREHNEVSDNWRMMPDNRQRGVEHALGNRAIAVGISHALQRRSSKSERLGVCRSCFPASF